MLIGAVTGAGTSAVTGQDPLKGALLGAAGGAAFGGAATAGNAGTQAAAQTGTQAATQAALTDPSIAALTESNVAALSNPNVVGAGLGDTGVAAQTLGSQGLEPLRYTPSDIMNPGLNASMMGDGGVETVTNLGLRSASAPSQTGKAFPRIAELYAKNPIMGPAGAGALSSVIGSSYDMRKDEEERRRVPGYSGPLSRFSYNPDTYIPYRAASGGLMDTEPARRMAGGGLGSYSDGGQTLQGPGDGMSDSIPATIGGSQPARLADGEFVVPADVVSGIGNGSTDAGARQLYSMMDKVREARTGRTRQAPEINPRRVMPA
jgi:hypothetical protein